MIITVFIISILYLLLIGSFVLGFEKVKNFRLEDSPLKTTFSVIIPFRNEAVNLSGLLKSISKLNYPKHLFEVILVDDESEDESVEIINTFLDTSLFQQETRIHITIIKNIRKTNSPKKDAITTAIDIAKYPWIITTDADCLLPKYWLDSFDAFIKNSEAICVAGPVTYELRKGFLYQFQLMDLLSLQGATIGGFGLKKPFLCNGANFAYEKKLFKALNGFEGNSHIASGDDIFFLEKIVKKNPDGIQYLKCQRAIVTTKPQESWENLVHQRVRWAAKTSTYNNAFGKLTGIIVLLINALVVTSFFLLFFKVLNTEVLLYILVQKFSIDLLLIYKTGVFFNQKEVFKSYILGFLVYPFFSSYVAIKSIFKDYNWKGRTFKK